MNIYFCHGQNEQKNVGTILVTTDSNDIRDVLQYYESLVESLISLGHLPPHISTVRHGQARHSSNNNNN